MGVEQNWSATVSESLQFDHRGHHVRVERRTNGWAVLLDGTAIDRIPPYEGEDEAKADLEGIARQAINAHLENRAPRL